MFFYTTSQRMCTRYRKIDCWSPHVDWTILTQVTWELCSWSAENSNSNFVVSREPFSWSAENSKKTIAIESSGSSAELHRASMHSTHSFITSNTSGAANRRASLSTKWGAAKYKVDRFPHVLDSGLVGRKVFFIQHGEVSRGEKML